MQLNEMTFQFNKETKNYYVFKEVNGINQLYIPKQQFSGQLVTVLTVKPEAK